MSKRRNEASSRHSIRLVLAMKTPANPSICVSISLTCVTSQLCFAPRRSFKKLSTSSISKTAPSASAFRNAAAISFSVGPTHMLPISDARLTSSGRLSWAAGHRAHAVFPVPDGP